MTKDELKKDFGILKRLITWVKSIASENNGTGSASRVVKLMLASTCSLALLMYVWYKHDLPTANQLNGLAAIIAAGSVAYVANQFNKSKNDPPPEDPDGEEQK